MREPERVGESKEEERGRIEIQRNFPTSNQCDESANNIFVCDVIRLKYPRVTQTPTTTERTAHGNDIKTYRKTYQIIIRYSKHTWKTFLSDTHHELMMMMTMK